jgi:hypothetical protein
VSKRKWASDDDAGDLLAGILNETEMDARAEEERIQREIQAREAEERRRQEMEEERKRQEAEARISAEMERQNQNAERRTQKMEALKIEDLKARGEWVDPEIEAAKKRAEEEAKRQAAEQQALAEARRAAAEAKVASEAVMTSAPAAAVAANTNSKMKFVVGGLVAALLIAAGTLGAVASGSYEPDVTPYSKVTYSPKDVQVAMVEHGFTLIPKAEPEPAAEEPKARTSRPAARKGGTTAKAAPAPKTDAVGKKANQRTSELEKMLQSAGDPFGM